MWSYLAVPTHLRELWWIFSPCLTQLKDGTFHLYLSYLAFFKINRREYDSNDIMVHQHWALRHSFWYVVPHLGSRIVSSHPTLCGLNMWSSWVRKKGTTQVMYFAKLKDGPKRVKKIFSMILGRVFEMV
jgi:hypothetical protein